MTSIYRDLDNKNITTKGFYVEVKLVFAEKNGNLAIALARSPLLVHMQLYAVFDVCVRISNSISGEPEEPI